jgi:hypothetical protein
LVYRYVSGGSLERHLHGILSCSLIWDFEIWLNFWNFSNFWSTTTFCR